MDTRPDASPQLTPRHTLMISGERFLLLIDENEWENQFTRTILNQVPGIKDFRILSNGWNALIYLDVCKTKNAFPDLILVDLHMTEINGFDFIERFEKSYQSGHSRCKIVILTHSDDPGERTRALQYSSVCDFIRKPLTPEKFDAHILPHLT